MTPAESAGGEPGPPPLPPPDLHARPLPVHIVPAGMDLWRIHPADRDPLFFGPGDGRPPRGRWDSLDWRFGVCYVAEQRFAAFAETFLREPGVMVLETPDLEARSLARLQVIAPLRLAAMHGPGLHAVGATSASCTGDYSVSRAWAAAIHAHPDGVDGIRYRARHDDDGFAIALFDRVERLIADLQSAPLTHPTSAVYLAESLNRYRIGLL